MAESEAVPLFESQSAGVIAPFVMTSAACWLMVTVATAVHPLAVVAVTS